CFFFSSRRRHTRSTRDWSSDVCSSDLAAGYTLTTLYEIVPLKRARSVVHTQMQSAAGELSELLLTAKLQLNTRGNDAAVGLIQRSEEHTSELQSRVDLVCRLLLEKKKI